MEVWGKRLKLAPSKHPSIQIPREGQEVGAILWCCQHFVLICASVPLQFTCVCINILDVFCLSRTLAWRKISQAHLCIDSATRTRRTLWTSSHHPLRCIYSTYRTCCLFLDNSCVMFLNVYWPVLDKYFCYILGAMRQKKKLKISFLPMVGWLTIAFFSKYMNETRGVFVSQYGSEWLVSRFYVVWRVMWIIFVLQERSTYGAAWDGLYWRGYWSSHCKLLINSNILIGKCIGLAWWSICLHCFINFCLQAMHNYKLGDQNHLKVSFAKGNIS